MKSEMNSEKMTEENTKIKNDKQLTPQKPQKPTKKKEKWVKLRHKIIVEILRIIFVPICYFKYGIRVERARELDGRQILGLFNHQTAYDQFFFGEAFRGVCYYVATEDIFSLGWLSRALSWAQAPIPIKKQTTDIRAMRNILQVVKEGGNLALAPEGNRTFDGRTCYIKPTIAPLARKLKLPIVLFRIEDGYGVQPRWSDVIRRGKMRAHVARVIEPEEAAAMTDDELYKAICDGLYVNEAKVTGEFKHKKTAEYLERCVYVCPDCGLSRFESHNDEIACLKCGQRIRYKSTKELEGIGKPFPFRFVADWYDYQQDFVNHLDPTADNGTPIYEDTADVYDVILYKKKNRLYKNAVIRLYGDRVTITPAEGEPIVCRYDEKCDITILGKNKLNVYVKDRIYQLKGDVRFNALKYINLHQRSLNIMNGEPNSTFLGM